MTYAGRTTDRALKYIQEFQDSDFFLTVSYDEPHGPFICPAPFNTMYEGFTFPDDPAFSDDLQDKPMMQRLWAGNDLHKSAREINKSSQMLSLFLGCNSFVDDEIGKVLAQVEAVAPDALVVFTSDHGDMLGAHKLQGKNACFYDQITNVPFIVRNGSNDPNAGSVNTTCVSHVDLAPTFLQYFQIPVPKLLEGKSLMPCINDPSTAVNDHVFVEFTRYEVDHDGFGGLQMMRSVTDGRWKLSVNLMDSDELYDLLSDPSEVHNLINDPACSEIRESLHDALLGHMNDTRDPYRGYQWLVRPWRRNVAPSWQNDGYTRQRENEEYEPRQWDYDTGMPMEHAVRNKQLYDVKK